MHSRTGTQKPSPDITVQALLQGLFLTNYPRARQLLAYLLGACLLLGTPYASAQLNSPRIATGHYHTMVLMADGTVRAWGLNVNGQLGNGTTTDSYTPTTVPGLSGITAIVTGSGHSAALKNDRTVWTWGANSNGQLGNGTVDKYDQPPTGLLPAQVTLLPATATAVATGELHTVALMNDGTVWAWGFNAYGQLGNGSTAGSPIPLKVLGLTNVIAIAAGDNHTVAMKGDGTIWAWGLNSNGQLGNCTGPLSVALNPDKRGNCSGQAVVGFPVNSLTPVQVPGIP